MSKSQNLIKEILKETLNESVKMKRKEAMQIGELAKKEAEKSRKDGGRLADEDVKYMEDFADYAFKYDLKSLSKAMHKGETENRETAFEIVSSVIGINRARDLYQSN